MDEVKAAAERLVKAEAEQDYQYWDGNRSPFDPDQDGLTVARQYLAEHPADEDETITEDWLRSVGGAQEDNPIKWTFYRNDAMPIGLWHVDDGWKAMLLYTESAASCIVRGLTTRGDLRRVAAALNIPLQGAPDGEASEA